MMYSILPCIVLYCIALPSLVLHCIVLYCIVLYSIVTASVYSHRFYLFCVASVNGSVKVSLTVILFNRNII